jgi:hypothetical protein
MADRFPAIPNEASIDLEFFRKYGVSPAETAFREWTAFLQQGRPRSWGKYLKCLAICANVRVPSVKAWRSHQLKRFTNVGREHVVVFQVVTLALGLDLPRELRIDRPDYGRLDLGARPGPARVSLFVSFSVVSEPYHLALMRTLVRHAAESNVLLSVHDLPWSHPVSEESAQRAGLIVTKYAPDAVILMRLTPSQSFLKEMVFDLKALPVVVIHADRQAYPHPVLANIVPDHRGLADELGEHVQPVVKARKGKKPSAILIAMPEETEPEEKFSPLAGVPRSIRNDRIAAITAALGGFRVVRTEVPDYSFRHARRILLKHPDADLYLCLSDQLAVSLKHLMLARGVSEEECHRKIVGFDGSPLAAQERIASLSQGLEEIGQRVLARLCQFLPTRGTAWVARDSYHAEEIPIAVKLIKARAAEEQ